MKETDSDKVSVVHYYKNTSDSDLTKLIGLSDGLSKQYGVYNPNGLIYCRFSRAKTTNNPLIADLSRPHYIYVERGAPGNHIFVKFF
jgi:hypothetical protein